MVFFYVNHTDGEGMIRIQKGVRVKKSRVFAAIFSVLLLFYIYSAYTQIQLQQQGGDENMVKYGMILVAIVYAKLLYRVLVT